MCYSRVDQPSAAKVVVSRNSSKKRPASMKKKMRAKTRRTSLASSELKCTLMTSISLLEPKQTTVATESWIADVNSMRPWMLRNSVNTSTRPLCSTVSHPQAVVHVTF